MLGDGVCGGFAKRGAEHFEKEGSWLQTGEGGEGDEKLGIRGG